MKSKIIMFFTLAVIAMNLSSCIVREEGGHRGWHHHHHDHDHAEVIIR